MEIEAIRSVVDFGAVVLIWLVQLVIYPSFLHYAESDLVNWHKIYTNFNNERNEIFFSNKVILVEGASDKVLLETLCSEKWDVDLDECGYSIVECGGKNGVKYFVVRVDVSSASHPFYTGKQNILDTSGRVDKFRAKMEKAQALKS